MPTLRTMLALVEVQKPFGVSFVCHENNRILPIEFPLLSVSAKAAAIVFKFWIAARTLNKIERMIPSSLPAAYAFRG